MDSNKDGAVMEKYLKILKLQGMRVTHQRLEIMKYLDENRNHPNAEKIYSILKEKNPSLSKTTVYNSVDILRKHNIIQTLNISKAELRYDFDNSYHHHFLCKVCGNIIDINVKCPYLEKIINGENKIEEVHGYFKGICKNCLNVIEKKEGSTNIMSSIKNSMGGNFG